MKTTEIGSFWSLTPTCRDLRSPLLIMNNNGAGRFPLQLLPWRTSSAFILVEAGDNLKGMTCDRKDLWCKSFGIMLSKVANTTKARGLAAGLRYWSTVAKASNKR